MKNHFTTPVGWLNDPNGAIYIDGTYHLFYQHYPDANVWGPMHWGHAVSEDLLNWEDKDIAIFPDKLGYIFSGSCILDEDNVSGLGSEENPPLIAIYTSHNPETEEQQQSISYSLDYERFAAYEENPVIKNTKGDLGFKKDFRDPKIFKNPVLGGYSIVLSGGPKIEFYHSDNLLLWEKTGEFNPEDYSIAGVCECPDCFMIEDKWVLTLSIYYDKDGKSCHDMPYFVGSFDGRTFICEENYKYVPMIDYGPDNYAMVTFNNSPNPLLIGWGENWDYVNDTPLIASGRGSNFVRGKMTLPRNASLVKTADGYRLSFSCDLVDRLSHRLAKNETLKLKTTGNGELEIYYEDGYIFVDRTEAVGGFLSDKIKDEHYLVYKAPYSFSSECEIKFIEDNGYYEIFVDDGTIVFTIMTW